MGYRYAKGRRLMRSCKIDRQALPTGQTPFSEVIPNPFHG